MAYLSELASQMGISLWLLVVIFLWSAVWKFLALWKSARKNNLVWFIVFALVNTVGILEILYIYVFSDMKNEPKKEKISDSKKSARKNRR